MKNKYSGKNKKILSDKYRLPLRLTVGGLCSVAAGFLADVNPLEIRDDVMSRFRDDSLVENVEQDERDSNFFIDNLHNYVQKGSIDDSQEDEPTIDEEYVVQEGDTLSHISLRKGVSVENIAKANNIANVNAISNGQKLIIPYGQDGEAERTFEDGDGSGSLEETVSESYRSPADNRGQEVKESDEIYNNLERFIGKPYGPIYPTGEDEGKEMYDCVSLIIDFAKEQGVNLTGNQGDQFYHRHMDPVTTLNPDNHDLDGIKTGDIVIIGHQYPLGEGGISGEHLGIVGKVDGEDTTMVHASGWYSEDRERYGGDGVKEENLLGYLESRKINDKMDHMFIGRLKD